MPSKPARGLRSAWMVGWSETALLLTAVIAVAAKTFGVLVMPGLRGAGKQSVVETMDTLSASLAYTLAGLLVALVCAASFDLARSRSVGVAARGSVVAISGLVVALASPAVVQRLQSLAAIALAVVTSIIVLVAAVSMLRAARTRAAGALFGILAIVALVRVVAWELDAVAVERASASMQETARGLATLAVVLHGVAVLVIAAWLGTRSRWRGRILANAAIMLAFLITYGAARGETSSSLVEAVLRSSLVQSASSPPPFGLATVAAFLVPASTLLAGVALVLRRSLSSQALAAAIAFGLLSHGAFDVPLQALLVTAGAQWAMLAAAEETRHG